MSLNYVEDISIRALRVRAWVRSVRLASGLSLLELEKKFVDSKKPSSSARSCIWDKYARGSVVPRIGKKPNGELHLANRVNNSYPDTLQWLVSPIWRLSDIAPMSMIEIKEAFEGMPYLYRSIFIEAEYKTKGVFWRRDVDLESCFATLNKLDTIPAFIALLTLVKEAELTQDQATHQSAFVEAISYEDKLSALPELEFIYEYLFDYLDQRLNYAGYFNNLSRN